MKKIHSVCYAALVVLAGSSLPAQAFNIVFDYTYDSSNFFSGARRNVMEQVANVFETRIQDKLSAINSSGSNNFNLIFTRPDSDTSVTVEHASIPANTIVIYAGGRDLASGTLGQGGGGGYSVSGSSGFIETATKRGQSGAPATDYALWGGIVSFDATSSWYADSNAKTLEPFSGYDLYSVALHEVGHVLGIGASQSWENLISGDFFTGAAASAEHGGPVPVVADASHWVSGLQSTYQGITQEAAMTPSIGSSRRNYFTELDWQGLKDIGWEVAPAVPEPASYMTMLVGLGMLGAYSKLRRKAD